MLGLIIKIIVCPLAIMLSDYLFADVYYPYIYESIITGLVLAVVAHFMEVMILKRGTFWISTIADFVAAAVIVYLSQFFFRGSSITFVGALLTSIIISITEILQHLYLIKSGRTKKSEIE